VTCIRGKANVVTFRSTAEKIVRQFSQEKNVNRDSEEEKLRIIKTAAKLLLADIKSMDTSRDEYPSRSDMENTQKNLEYIPASLHLFLTTLLSNKKDSAVKMASLGQALIQAARPKVVLTPWQLGLAVELHHLYASKYLIRHLNRLGFCCTYDEVKRFLQNAALTQGVELDGMFGESCVQFVADNVDHNIRTLDGQGTFHGMGMIAAVTPATRTVRRIKRDTTINAKHVEAAGRIQMKFWSAKESQQRLVYEMLPNFSGSQAHSFIDMVWNVSWPLRSPRPGWSGFMQAVSHGTHPGQTQVTFLPMIDMNPTDMSCVFTTLHFLSSLAERHRVTPVITFDQPLWWKAMMIITNEPNDSPLKPIVLRLGGFHTEMSFLGSIGNLMAGSGLQDVMEIVYAANAVPHILTGKSLARAVRAHFLVYSVVHALLTSQALDIPLDEDTEGEITGGNLKMVLILSISHKFHGYALNHMLTNY
jgi:hypothetical protein